MHIRISYYEIYMHIHTYTHVHKKRRVAGDLREIKALSSVVGNIK
jgi:hypothetical protein